jgi:aspartyl-tRNA(Asn)/glutamyl-tRNA(Gln) amidotransferase subunit A
VDLKQGAPIATLTAALAVGEITATELVAYYDERIRALNPEQHTFITVRDRADIFSEVEAVKNKKDLPYRGIPIAIKDTIAMAGYETTGGTKELGCHPKRDAAIVVDLKNAGFIIMGKTNMHELAHGITGENVHFGTVANPADPTRMAGGSSSGSAAAVAAGMVPVAVGSDTVGSIRIPAAFCGIYGFKPTQDVISTDGCLPLSSTLDHLGFFARHVEDLLHLYRVTARAQAKAERKKEPLIGVPYSFFDPWITAETSASLEVFCTDISQKYGVRFTDVELPGLAGVREAGSAIVFREAWETYGFLLDQGALLGRDVSLCLAMGKEVSRQQYEKALRYREHFIDEMEQYFRLYDMLLLPAVPCPAPQLGTRKIEVKGKQLRLAEPLTTLNYPASFAGLPTLCMPHVGKDRQSVGFQLIGAPYTDLDLLTQFIEVI